MEEALLATNLIQLDPLIRINEADWPLIQTLLNNDTYQRMYIAHMRTILEENFSNGLYLTRANDLQSLVSSLIQADANSFYSFNDFSTILIILLVEVLVAQ